MNSDTTLKTLLPEDNLSRDEILVIGHCNPDTDAAASATAYATFINLISRYPDSARAVIPGSLTPQMRWVFNNADVKPPLRVDSLSSRVRDACCRNPISLQQNDTLGQATDLLIRSGHTMLPIVDEQNVVVGVFSHRDEAGRMLIGFDVTPLISSLLRWSDVLNIPGVSVKGTLPDDTACGSMHILLEGSQRQTIAFNPEDLVVCGSLAFLQALPVAHRPRRAVVVNSEIPNGVSVSPPTDEICELKYSGTVSEFLRQLNRCIPLKNLHFPVGPCVGADDAVRDISSMISSCRRALPVVDCEGRLFGVVASGDLANVPQRRAILVDHFECSQLATGLDDLQILEIVDHHRIGDIQTLNPVRVDCRPIGSSCSIVAMNFFEHGLQPDKSTARLMLGGLCSDTLGLTSPTTTPVDHQVAERLAVIAEVDLDSYVIDVLKAGDDLHLSVPSAIWNRDQKVFSVRNRRFAVAQLETVALEELSADRLQEFLNCLESHFSASDLLCSLLVITDVLQSRSIVAVCESADTSGAVTRLYARPADSTANASAVWLPAPGVVSRKKQIIPNLMRCLAELPQAS